MRAHIFPLSILALGANLVLACNFGDSGGYQPTKPAKQAGVHAPTIGEIPDASTDPLPLPEPDPDPDPDPLPNTKPPVKTPVPVPTPTCKVLPFVSQDDQIKLMADDISDQRKEDREFTRYLTITYSSNAGACEGDRLELQRQRFALFKGINSVSTNPVVTKPVAIDENETIYRIDIRDYDWDRPIDTLGNDNVHDDGLTDEEAKKDNFANGWQAIVATVDEFAILFTGENADSLAEDAALAEENDVPFLPVNAFNHFTQRDDLYYSLIKGTANLHDYESGVLGINVAGELKQDNVLRAGFRNSGVSRQDRAVDRFNQGTANGHSYWVSYDLDGSAEQDSIYFHPTEETLKSPAGESIFSLPNGLQGYYAAQGAFLKDGTRNPQDGQRLKVVPQDIVVDPGQPSGNVVNGASCHSCHNAGMITFTDTVRSFVEANRSLYTADEVEDVLARYPLSEDFKAVTDADSELHVKSVEKAGVPRGYPDAISRVFLDFQSGRITSKIAAGELQVPERELLRNLINLDPKLSVLADSDGHVDRGTFTSVFFDSMRKLHANDDNPVAAVLEITGTDATP